MNKPLSAIPSPIPYSAAALSSAPAMPVAVAVPVYTPLPSVQATPQAFGNINVQTTADGQLLLSIDPTNIPPEVLAELLRLAQQQGGAGSK